MQKIISIIIATYNAGRTLSRCLESIELQKTEETELLVIDGGSTDSTKSIVSSFSNIIDTCVSEPDKGIYDAWNKGVKLAHGKWIMFIGADDILEPNALKLHLENIQKNDISNVDLICGRCKLVDDYGNVIKLWGKPYIWEEFRKRMVISHGSTLHNVRLFEEIGYFNPSFKICGDYEFLIRKPMKSLFLDKVIIDMQVGGASTTYASLKEAYLIRKKYNSVNNLSNIYLYLRGTMGLYIRKKLGKS